MKTLLNLTINGRAQSLEVETHRTLTEVIRDQLGLLGTKEGCGQGKCGACTVLLNGRPVNSCLLLAVQAEGADIITIEGLAKEGRPDPLQQAFVDHGAVQCGFCTPGMILTAKALLNEEPEPDAQKVKQALSGNLCRCTGYNKITEAVLAAAAGEKEADNA